MPRFYVQHDGMWNVYSTISDDFIYENFMPFEELKEAVLDDLCKRQAEDLDTLLTDNPVLNVMDYSEALRQRRVGGPAYRYWEPIDLSEFNDLEDLLKRAGVEYEREDDSNNAVGYEFHQLRHPMDANSDRYLWDVVCSTGTYGSDEGLLELWGKDMPEPEGYLSAKECAEKILEILRNEERS